MAADASGRGINGARRIPSGALDDYAFFHQNQGVGSGAAGTGSGASTYHSLRPVESRFSLREQFATTRRDFEFGFDDAASSIIERSTIASEAGRGADIDQDGGHPSITVGMEQMDGSFVQLIPSWGNNTGPLRRDHYELLCLPRDPSPSPDDIRRAFHRLVQLLSVDRQPARLQRAAASYLGLVQVAFETLIEPYKRAEYDLFSKEVNETDSDCGDDNAVAHRAVGLGESDAYESILQEQRLLLGQRGLHNTTDLAVRIETGSLLDPAHNATRPNASGLNIVDFALSQSVAVGVPALRDPVEKTAQYLHDFFNDDPSSEGVKRPIRCADPTVAITGSTYGLLNEPYKLASLLCNPYQPPGPSIHGRRRLEQLLSSRFLPMLNLNIRQELFWQDPLPSVVKQGARSRRALPDFVVEQEVEILPHPSVTVRLGHSIDHAEGREPLNVELSAQKLLGYNSNLVPSLGLALRQRVGSGTAFAVADAGDWDFWPSKECREMSRFSKLSKGFSQTVNPFRNGPTVEAGYRFGSEVTGLESGRALTKPSNGSVRRMDYDLEDDQTGSWTASVGLTTGNAAAYLRYGRDLFSSLTSSQSSALPPGNSSHSRSGFRAEVELASSTSTQRDLFLAFRTLKRIGRFCKVGLEVGLTPNNMHVSLYWSRLGQRISIPFLVATKSSLSAKLVFWSAVIPFAGFAALEFLCWRPWTAARKGAATKKDEKKKRVREDMQEYIARRRTEADDLTVVLATGAEPRQRAERQRGGLVILSAKYGVKDAPPDEIADVTIAVAALVDGEALRIPRGIRKSRLLGFWDPAPESTKVLCVRYMYRGKEQVVEVSGREELRLP